MANFRIASGSAHPENNNHIEMNHYGSNGAGSARESDVRNITCSPTYGVGNNVGPWQAPVWEGTRGPTRTCAHSSETFYGLYPAGSADLGPNTSYPGYAYSTLSQWAAQAPEVTYCSPNARTRTHQRAAFPTEPRQAPLSATEASSAPHGGLRCLWGAGCGAPLQGTTIGEIRAHLREAHGVPGRDKATRIPCLWGGHCSRSSDPILPGGMGKHIATCHFKSMRKSCASCGQAFCRQDSLSRHELLYCPKLRRGDDERRKRRAPGSRRILSDIRASA